MIFSRFETGVCVSERERECVSEYGVYIYNSKKHQHSPVGITAEKSVMPCLLSSAYRSD